jgi:pilus assembly protein CpaE
MTKSPINVALQVKSQQVFEELRGAIVSSVHGFHVQNTIQPGDSDILILEIGEDYRKDCQTVSRLLGAGSVKDIFLVSSRVESDVLLNAMRSGAKEFFPLPLKKEELVAALLKFKERNKHLAFPEKSVKKGRIINVVGSKGGIGTTTIAVNLAASLHDIHNSRASVALIDMNLLFGEIPLFLDIEPAFNWGEVAKNISRLDSTYLMSILSKHTSGGLRGKIPRPQGLSKVFFGLCGRSSII